MRPTEIAGSGGCLLRVRSTVTTIISGTISPQSLKTFRFPNITKVLPAETAIPVVRPPGRLVLSNAVLALVREAAAAGPVLMILDDLHWADRASATVLGYAARRLGGSRAGFIGAMRSGEETFFEQAGIPSREIGPLDEGAASALLAGRFPALAARVRDRLLAEAQGNPLALLELPVPLSEDQRRARTALPAVLPLTRRLQSLFAARVAQLPEPPRQLLVLAALDGTGDLGVLQAAVHRSPDALAPAERAGLIRFTQPGGRLAFSHPLIRSAVLEQSTIGERRRAHHALAGLARLAGEPEKRALHLAEAAAGPDEQVAALLEDAAYRTLRRGDSAGAVTALLRAADLSPAPDDRSRRTMHAAYVGVDVTGQLTSAAALLDATQQEGPGSSLQAAITAAHLLLNGDGNVDTAHRLLAGAIGDVLGRAGNPGAAAADDKLADAMHVLLLICWFGGRAELWHPFYATLARLTPGPPRLLRLTASVFADPARATAADLAELDERIHSLHKETDPPMIIRIADAASFVDRTGNCRAALWRIIRDARQGGAIASGINAMTVLAGEDFRQGRWAEAQQLADEGLALSEAHGYHLLGWLLRNTLALLAAGRGDAATVETLNSAMTGWAAPRRAGHLLRYAAHARTLAAIGQGDFEDAYRQAAAISPPGSFPPHIPHALRVPLDLVEAAVRTGRHAEAAAHVAAMQSAGMSAISTRLALVTAGATAIAAPDNALFEAALACPDASRWPFELARIRLAYGEHLRRSRASASASVQLAAALEVFERLGAAPWAGRAARELRATGQHRTRGTQEELSPRERQIAALAASGLTNKQIAEQLFLSPRTVGDHLHKIFPKLGITTRAALRDALDSGARSHSR